MFQPLDLSFQTIRKYLKALPYVNKCILIVESVEEEAVICQIKCRKRQGSVSWLKQSLYPNTGRSYEVQYYQIQKAICYQDIQNV